MNYWWGLQSDAERVDYYEELAGGNRSTAEPHRRGAQKHELAIFPAAGSTHRAM